jgi:uncharacterized phage-associated protein
MTVSVLSAARYVAHRSGWTLSNLELQKILYLAHMFYLGRTNGSPLVSGNFEAWDYGPVHPDLYHRAKMFGSKPVQDIFSSNEEPKPDTPEYAILEEAYVGLGSAGPGRLVNATHRKGGAWEAAYVPGQRHCIIPNDDILREYRELPEAANGA